MSETNTLQNSQYQQQGCKRCGACPHCGRGAEWFRPYNPWYPSYPNLPWYTSSQFWYTSSPLTTSPGSWVGAVGQLTCTTTNV